jgi:hypothetical protein
VEVIVIKGHSKDCALNEDGPCTCGTYKELDDLAREEAGESAVNFARQDPHEEDCTAHTNGVCICGYSDFIDGISHEQAQDERSSAIA